MRNKKGVFEDLKSLLLMLVLIAVILGFIAWKFKPALFGAAEEYSAKEFGGLADLDNDQVRNQFDQCPAKACTPNPGEQIDANPTSDRYGCTDSQTPCGTSMECRQAATC